MRFRKKPVVIEAVQWTGENRDEILGFAKGCDRPAVFDEHGLTIPTLEGTHFANVGDWIIKGVHGELYPCKPDIFSETYELEE